MAITNNVTATFIMPSNVLTGVKERTGFTRRGLNGNS
nr:MAG TPA: hypothetical protein [Caudoviricetes sp.]